MSSVDMGVILQVQKLHLNFGCTLENRNVSSLPEGKNKRKEKLLNQTAVAINRTFDDCEITYFLYLFHDFKDKPKETYWSNFIASIGPSNSSHNCQMCLHKCRISQFTQLKIRVVGKEKSLKWLSEDLEINSSKSQRWGHFLRSTNSHNWNYYALKSFVSWWYYVVSPNNYQKNL